MARVFVSGSNGFIGRVVTSQLLRAGHDVIGGVRQPAPLAAGVTPLITGDLADSVPALPELDAVIHTAGLAHQHGRSPETMMRGNVVAAENLARATPANARFIFLSSIVVHGRASPVPLTDATLPAPHDEYARSKLMAEQMLTRHLGQRLNIIRPAAVIGPHCPGNIALLLKVLRRGLPLPLGAIQNERSFIDVEDLARLILMCLTAAAPRVMLAAHPTPISTPGLIRALANGLNRRARLWPLPPACLALAAHLTGKEQMWKSLSGDLVVRPEAALQMGWQPATSLTMSLEKTAAAG